MSAPAMKEYILTLSFLAESPAVLFLVRGIRRHIVYSYCAVDADAIDASRYRRRYRFVCSVSFT